MEPRAKARGNSIVTYLNSYIYNRSLTAIGNRAFSVEFRCWYSSNTATLIIITINRLN